MKNPIDKMTNCPNCAAPLDGLKCTYCGTTVYDCTDMDIDMMNSHWFRFKRGGDVFVGRFYLDSMSVNYDTFQREFARTITGEMIHFPAVVQRTIHMDLIEVPGANNY